MSISVKHLQLTVTVNFLMLYAFKIDLVFKQSVLADDLREYVFADMNVDGCERVVKEIDINVLIDGSGQRYSLFLSSRQVYTLQNNIFIPQNEFMNSLEKLYRHTTHIEQQTSFTP